jgi:superfamily II DNA helicase RecQ
VPTTNECKKIYDIIAYGSMPMSACIHYGAMGKKERAANESLFRNDMAKVMVATSSFGMGVDTVNVQCVVNYGFLLHVDK